MVTAVQKFIRTTDATVAGAYLGLFRERGALLAFLFHSLFADESQVQRNDVDPLQRTTVAQLRQFIEYYRDHGYRFVAPEDLLSGLPAGGKYALITFDDGYYNNTLALPVLEALGAPAVFFVSSDNVRLGKCFWWDVLHRQRVARGASANDIYREGLELKSLPTEQIERRLSATFGAGAFTPRGDIDRPFTPAELRQFSRHPLVRIGNHTANHAILTNYPVEEARGQVVRAQEWLAETTGRAPTSIAYPNGDYDDSVVRTCREVGLRMGFTVRPGKTSLTLGGQPRRAMEIGRFTPHADAELLTQCRTYRSDLQLYGSFRRSYLWLRGGSSR